MAIMPYKIPFNKPCLIGDEIKNIQEACNSGHISGNGLFTQKCQTLIEKDLQIPKALLTTSCTHALEMTALLLNIKEGDEVIVPSFTFVTTVNAFVLRGAIPVFIDINPDTLNLDEKLIKNRITPRTKAIVCVHYAGVGCEMDEILEIANINEIAVIEDNAHGLYGKYKDKYLGTFGCMATLSFHETKNFSCGEGGALLINDLKYMERAEIVREKGTNRKLFLQNLVDKYTWVDLGSSYLPSDILAAFLYAQLSAREKIQAQRKSIWEYYQEKLEDWANDHNVALPFIPNICNQSYHMFYMIMPSYEKRKAMISHLRDNGILSVFHYLPLHLSKMGRRFGGKDGDCPVTENISGRLLRLPFFYDLTKKDMDKIIEAIKEF